MSELQIDDVVYRLRDRLDWLEQQRINDMGFQFILNGRVLTNLEEVRDLSDLDEVTVIPRTAEQNFARLCARLAPHLKPPEIKRLPARHVAALLARITALEAEEEAELASLEPGNPTTPRSEP
jgi:hypothetical protein